MFMSLLLASALGQCQGGVCRVPAARPQAYPTVVAAQAQAPLIYRPRAVRTYQAQPVRGFRLFGRRGGSCTNGQCR